MEESSPKRRKIRKGTRSCWECRRRKLRCQFASETTETCTGCESRGTSCVTQDHEDLGAQQHIVDKRREVEERIRRAEGLLEKMIEAASRFTPATEAATPGSERQRSRSVVEPGSEPPITRTHPVPEDDPEQDDDQWPPPPMSPSASPTAGSCPSIQVFDSTLVDGAEPPSEQCSSDHLPPLDTRYRQLCHELLAALPSQGDADLILSSEYTASFLQFFVLSYKDIFHKNMRSALTLSALPTPASHPVLIARKLLYLANGLQNFHSLTDSTSQLDLGSDVTGTLKRFLDAASLVTNNDHLIGSLEGLECLFLQTVFHTNAGNLRRAWLVIKRAIGLAQLMGLHRRNPVDVVVLDPETKASPSIMWHRVTCQDRYLALMLGLPAATAKTAIPKPIVRLPEQCSIEYLERVHGQVMGCITIRNEESDADGDVTTTMSIDKAMQEAAHIMPANWWLLQTRRRRGNPGASETVENIEDVLRVLSQITHFNLLIMLHIPYMLRSTPGDTYSYSKAACVNASREVLARYIKFRCMNQVSFRCRSIDFAAFVACLTLTMAHLERWHRSAAAADFLAHQRPSDRAMMDETVNLMMELDAASSDSLLGQTASILESLLAIEADAASCVTTPAGSAADCAELGTDRRKRCLRLKIPYFGTVYITSNGIVSDAKPSSHVPVESDAFPSNDATNAEPQRFRNLSFENPLSQPSVEIPYNPSFNLQDAQGYAFYPSLTAEADNWALQGVDGTFFDQLLRIGHGANDVPSTQANPPLGIQPYDAVG
ncbi:C6 zinc finger domain-containing protein [Colletotrichum musicola]|uniref:C6 zinc finger domain-containing protein n=1 Tax=Colletotrichum musicola TaxID=2175873 RepID=A0A8H6MWW8_9PEZI|nr:C6 zinc finger domain-containing protein [Colletotrichum musicola]